MENRFRGSWTPRVDNAAASAEKKTGTAVKLVYDSQVRLVECELSMDALRSKVKDVFGVDEASTLTYQIPGDDDTISIVDDNDLQMAETYGGSPLRIVVVVVDSPHIVAKTAAKMPSSEDDPYTFAEKQLGHHGIEAPADEINLLLRTLDLKPRRLVKCGLAPPFSLKNVDGDDDEKQEWETVQTPEACFVQAEGVFLGSDGEEEKTKGCVAVASEASSDCGGGEDQIVRALRSKGIVRMAPSTIHALLRILDVPPNRFVKLGLVDDLAKARKAYKTGGANAAETIYRGKQHHMWGRGLCGGRGMARGKGWGFRHHHLHMMPPPHHHHHPPSSFHGFGSHWHRDDHHRGPHGHHPPPPHFFRRHGGHHPPPPPPHHRHGPPPPHHGPPPPHHGPPPPHHGPPPPCKGKALGPPN